MYSRAESKVAECLSAGGADQGGSDSRDEAHGKGTGTSTGSGEHSYLKAVAQSNFSAGAIRLFYPDGEGKLVMV